MSKYFFRFWLVLALAGCARQPADAPADRQSPMPATGFMPGKDSVAQPMVTLLDTCPPPATFITANAASPALMSPAIFSVNMITYAAEKGLYSFIRVIKADGQGNFWFCTGGGGVIRYDGKTATSFTTAQGLASNNVGSIAEDRQGNLWFGSVGGGVSIYDGKVFTTINKAKGLNNNSIRGIVAGEQHQMWLATAGGGINIYNGASYSFITARDGLLSDMANCMIQARNGAVWYGTDSGISCVRQWDVQRHKGKIISLAGKAGIPLKHVLSLTEDRNGNIWAGTDGGGVSCIGIAGDTLQVIRTFNTQNGLPNNIVRNVFEDSRGKLWFCTAGSGVSCYDPVAYPVRSGNGNLGAVPGALTTYSIEHGLCSNRVECAAEDESGNLWFGTDGGGVSRFDGAHFKLRIEPRNAVTTSITCINADHGGNIWFTSNVTGILCYDGKYFRSYTTGNILGDLNNSVLCMLQDSKGRYWMGTSGKGLYCCSEGPASGHPARFTVYNTAQGLPANRVYCIAEDGRGRLWAGTAAGVVCIDGNKVITYNARQGLRASAIWCSLMDKKGNMWFGTFGGGICRLIEHPADGGAARFLSYTTKDGLPSNSIKSMLQDGSGNIWITTGGGGVSRFDGNSFLDYSTIDGLANNIAVTVAEDKHGNLWFGTNEGLSLLRGFTPVSASRGKTSAPVVAAENSLPNSYVATQYQPVFEQYNFKNGFPIKDVNTNSMCLDSAGVLWAGTADKLICFDRAKLDKNVETPHVAINAISINGEKICWNVLRNQKIWAYSNRSSADDSATYVRDSAAMVNEEMIVLGMPYSAAKRVEMARRYSSIQFDSITPFDPLPVGLILPHRHNNITFDFTAIEPARPYLVRYKYKLDGYSKDWSPVTDRSSASFGNISEGTYTFKLCAQSPDGVWSAPATYTFTVLPPWYRSWWAYVLYILTFGYVIYMVVYVRTGILKKENVRLEAIVHERTEQIEQEKEAVMTQAEELRKLNLFKDKTFSVLSHDLRGPINTSATVLSMLDAEDLTADEFQDMKEGIVKQLTATSVLLDNLLKWAKGSMEGGIEAHKTSVNVFEIVQRHAVLFEENLKKKGIDLQVLVPNNLMAYFDVEQLDIVIRNLLANAIKFTPKNGTITISGTTASGELRLSVADTGVGMTQAQLEKLFKPATDKTTYGTAGEKGTGLGLLLSHEFIKANGGRIEVQSEPGKGTTFTLLLPGVSS